MANLKRNMIKLVKNPKDAMKGAEIEYETFWTSPFVPTDVTYEALDLADMLNDEEQMKKMKETEVATLLEKFVVDKLYVGQFTSKDLRKKFHGPDYMQMLQGQVAFITQGQQNDETKKFVEKKN